VFLVLLNSAAVLAESSTDTTEPELSQAVIIIGFFVIFLRFRIKGESNKTEMVKNEKKRSAINIFTWYPASSLFLLFLKYNSIAIPAAARIEASKNINQYFVPNEIKFFDFNEP
jgi:hypothetical protein